jgi:succinoglycan biosynthesis transport protein ExoP
VEAETVRGSGELQEYLAVFKARKWTFVAMIIVVVGATATLSYRKTPIYQAQTRVLVQPYPSADSSSLITPNLNTESQLVSSEQVAANVGDQLGLDGTRSVLSGLAVEAVEETEVLNVAYSSPDPRLAEDAANAFAQSYIEYRRDRALQALASARRPIEAKVKLVQKQLIKTTNALSATYQRGDQISARRLESKRGVLATRLVILQQRLDAVEPDTTVMQGGSQVIEEASRPSAPVSPNHKKDLFLGAALGVILGVGTIFLRERLDDRFRGRTDVAQVTGVPVLATVPKFNATSNGRGPTPIVATQPSSVASETYRTLRTNTEFTMLQRGFRSMVITSPSAGEGKTVTTANLGVAAAQAGGRVLIVSTDLRRPALEKHFGIENLAGISSWLVGQQEQVGPLVQSTPIPNLHLLPSGPVPPNPAELLAGARLEQLMTELEQTFDLVLLDSPPTLPVADAMILASKVGTTLMVVNAATTRRSAAAHAKERLQSVGAELIGTVLNAFDPATSPYGYQPYYYYYYPYQSQQAPGLPTNGTTAPPSALGTANVVRRSQNG